MCFILEDSFWVKSLRIVRTCWKPTEGASHLSIVLYTIKWGAPTFPLALTIKWKAWGYRTNVELWLMDSCFNLIQQGMEKVLWMGLSLVFFL